MISKHLHKWQRIPLCRCNLSLSKLRGQCCDGASAEKKDRINGVQAQMKELNFNYGITLGELIMRHTDMLNQTQRQTQRKRVCLLQ